MGEKQLQGLRVAILVETNFEQVELTDPRKALEEAGATTKTISSKSGKLTGMNHDEKKDNFKVDATLDEVSPDDFDAVLLPGGALNADTLRAIPKAQEFVQKIDKAGKPMAVICHAPWLLISAGLAKGRHLTSYHTIQDDLRNAGARWEDKECIRDRNLVTSRKPDDIPVFNREMISLFGEAKKSGSKAA